MDNHSTKSGCKDKIPIQLRDEVSSSFRLIHVYRLQIAVLHWVKRSGTPNGACRAGFDMRVTIARFGMRTSSMSAAT